jgi:hypothetical protein
VESGPPFLSETGFGEWPLGGLSPHTPDAIRHYLLQRLDYAVMAKNYDAPSPPVHGLFLAVSENSVGWSCDRITGIIKTRADGRKYFECSDGKERDAEFQTPLLTPAQIQELLNRRTLARGESNSLEYWEAQTSQNDQGTPHQSVGVLVPDEQ